MSTFISYSHEDEAIARRLATDLVQRDVKVWIDAWKAAPGDSFVKEIGDGLEKALYVCVLVSRSSLASEWVRREVALAIEESHRRDVRIVPLRVDDSEVPPELADRVYIDLRDYEAGFSRLWSILRRAYSADVTGYSEADERYQIMYGFEELPGDTFGFGVDVVSVDRDEDSFVLTQFEFAGNEFVAHEGFGLDSADSIRDHLLKTCADAFDDAPSHVMLRSTDVYRSTFTIVDAAEEAEVTINVRCRRVGAATTSTMVFNLGALFAQICTGLGIR